MRALSFHSALFSILGRVAEDRVRAGESDMDLNGIQSRPRPLWMQLVQGKLPLHRFLEERQAVQAVLALKRFAGSTFGRPMMNEEYLGF